MIVMLNMSRNIAFALRFIMKLWNQVVFAEHVKKQCLYNEIHHLGIE